MTDPDGWVFAALMAAAVLGVFCLLLLAMYGIVEVVDRLRARRRKGVEPRVVYRNGVAVR